MNKSADMGLRLLLIEVCWSYIWNKSHSAIGYLEIGFCSWRTLITEYAFPFQLPLR